MHMLNKRDSFTLYELTEKWVVEGEFTSIQEKQKQVPSTLD